MNYPVAIIGAPRSGTTLMSTLLRECIGYEGHREGQFFTLLNKLIKTLEEEQTNFELSYRKKENCLMLDVTSPLRIDLINLFQSYLYKAYNNHPWCVKTPNVHFIESLPLFKEIYPKAKLIYLKRRGIENILSQNKKFNRDQFYDVSCKQWTNCYLNFFESSIPLEALVIDQLALIDRPDLVATHLIDYLDLSINPQKIIDFITQNQFQKSSTLTSHYIPLEDTPWTQEEQQRFLGICQETMEKAGYPITKAAIAKFKPSERFYVQKITLSNPEKIYCEHQLTAWNEIPLSPFLKTVLHPNGLDKPNLTVHIQHIDFINSEQELHFKMTNDALAGPGVKITAQRVGSLQTMPVLIQTFNLNRKEQYIVALPKLRTGEHIQIIVANSEASKNFHNKSLEMQLVKKN